MFVSAWPGIVRQIEMLQKTVVSMLIFFTVTFM